MILNSARIENFKCIEDSTKFSLKPVTCLVGKNESGKSTLLHALYKLNPDIPEKGNFSPLLEYPRRKYAEYKERHDTDPDNVLTTEWELENSDIEVLNGEFGLNILKNNKVIITKGYDNKRHWSLEVNKKQILKNYLGSIELNKKEIRELKSGTVSELIDTLEAKETKSELESKILKDLKAKFPKGNSIGKVIEVLKKRLPVFLFFSEFYKMLGRVSIKDLLERRKSNSLEQPHRIFEALLALVGTNAEEMNKIGRFEDACMSLNLFTIRPIEVQMKKPFLLLESTKKEGSVECRSIFFYEIA